jgi:hypothetical protein
MSGCGIFCDGTDGPMTAKQRREYDATVESLGGPSSKAGKKWIDDQHKKFKAAQRAHKHR